MEAGKLAFTVDCWTSPYRMYPFMGVKVHWINKNWQLCQVGLKLHPLDGPHTGENLADCFCEILKEFEITEKVIR